MRWLRPPGRTDPGTRTALATPLDELDPETLEVLAGDVEGRLHGLPRWGDDDSLRETSYATDVADRTGTRGIWTAIAHS